MIQLATRAMRANPDGYTIQMGQMGTHATAVALYPNLAYKPDSDFAPIGLVSWVPVMIVARKDFPPGDLKEFIPYVKAKAQTLNVGHAGVGSIGFSCSLLVNSIVGVKPTMVPFNAGKITGMLRDTKPPVNRFFSCHLIYAKKRKKSLVHLSFLSICGIRCCLSI
jgi:tripartite-type tricarboxylate transporter receptor subunit TctC